MSCLNLGRLPPLKAFLATVALPSGVFGPVACCHGLHRCIACACFALRWSVHPLLIALLQKFVWLIFIFARVRRGQSAVVHLLRAVGDVGLLGIDDGRVLDAAQGFQCHPALVLSLQCHAQIALGCLKIGWQSKGWATAKVIPCLSNTFVPMNKTRVF